MATVIGLPESFRPSFPPQCAACLAPAGQCHEITVTVVAPVTVTRDGVTRVVGQRTEHRSFMVPYCQHHLPRSVAVKRRLRDARRMRLVLSLLLSLAAAGLAALHTRVIPSLPALRDLLRAAPLVLGAFAATLVVTFPLLLLPAMRMCGIRGACRAMFRLEKSVSLAVMGLPARQRRRWRRTTPQPEVLLRFGNRRYAYLFRRRNPGLG